MVTSACIKIFRLYLELTLFISIVCEMIKRILGILYILQTAFIGITYLLLLTDDKNAQLDLKYQDTESFFSRRITSSRNNSETTGQNATKRNQTSLVTPSVSVGTSTVRRTLEEDVKLTTFLLIMVSTLPESFVARESIRDTWYNGFNDSEDVIVRFAMGTNGTGEDVVARLHKENEAHNDLVIMEDIQDYYITPTSKTLSMIVWAHDHVDFQYFMKMDPITFVHVNNMVSVLQQRPTTKGLYYGRMQYKKKPNRKSSEYKDPTWDLTATYLPFALGGGYILSSDLITHMVRRKNYLRLHVNEDTAVASWIVAYNFERRDDDMWCVTKLNRRNQLEGDCGDYLIAQMCYGVSENNLREWFTKIAKSKT